MENPGNDLSRRELIAAGAGAGAAFALGQRAAIASADLPLIHETTFSGEGSGWGRGWRTTGVANLRREGGEGLLEAGSDVFPNDPRPVAFIRDSRLRDGEISADIARVGSSPGVVWRRTSPRTYYALIFDSERLELRLVRRDGLEMVDLAVTRVASARPPITLALLATGAAPTALRGELTDAGGSSARVGASDSAARLQRAGDPGVLARSETLFPSDRSPIHPAFGNLHLLPWGVQEGHAFMRTEVGQAMVDEIRRRSIAGFRAIRIRGRSRPRRSMPSIVAATTGAPVAGGARLQVATDLASSVKIEISRSPTFRNPRVIAAGRTDRFNAATVTARDLRGGRRYYWRPRAERKGRSVLGPTRSFRVMPQGGGRARITVAACGSQFGPIFDLLAAQRADTFIWQGDLNYPDTHGPLAQTMDGYAGIWRDFLANPLLAGVLERSAFAAQRDDHDYGIQDGNAKNIPHFPWGLSPWESLMNRRTYYRFPAGAAEVWVIDQRRFKTDPAEPVGPGRTLLGSAQRRWLLRTLERSRARFKVICSPCTVFMGANPRDGNWDAGYEGERDWLLAQIKRRVRGTTIFVTGDVHLTGVYERDGFFEARACPVGIPTPNDIQLVDPLATQNLRARPGVTYANELSHFAKLELSGIGRRSNLELSLVREDGAIPYRRRFE